MKVFQTAFSKIADDNLMRFDEKFQRMMSTQSWNVFDVKNKPLVRLSEVIEEDYQVFSYEDDFDYKGIPTGKVYLDEDGDVVDFQAVTKDDHPGRLKYKIGKDSILISSLRLARSPALNFDNFDMDDYVFSNGFYIFKTKSGWNKKFVLHLLRSTKIKHILDTSLYRGIGISAYRSEDLLKLQIPNISIETQNEIVSRIEPIEKRIKEIKKTAKSVQAIIDDFFARELGFNYIAFEVQQENRYYTSQLGDFSNNPDLRFGAKFHRPAGQYVMRELHKITDKKIKHYLNEDKPIKLGASISPADFDKEGSAYYISMATIKTCEVEFDDTQIVSDDYYKAKAVKSVKKGDIIVARSGEGTIGKVALIRDDTNAIFCDFTMRIRFGENYNAEFAYFYFRTSYFQYLIEIYKKGLGNNTNIFPIVMKEFPIPNLSKEEQDRLLQKLKIEINKQNEIKSKVAELRLEIEQAIYSNAIHREELKG